jgi:ATP-binding cassette subfamily B protein
MHPLKRIIRRVKPYWRPAVWALVLLIAMVVLDLSIPRLIQRLIDQGINAQNMTVVLHTSLLMILFSVLNAAAAVGNNIFSIRVGESVARDLRQSMFEKIETYSYSNLDQFPTGKLMVRLTSDASVVQRLVQISLRIGTRAPLTMIGSAILMVNTDTRLSITMLPILLVSAVVMVFFSSKMEPLFRSVQLKLDRMNTVLQENIAGARLVKAFARAEHEGSRFEAVNDDYTSRNVEVMQFMSAMGPLLTFLINIGVVIVIYFGGLQSMHGDMTIGQIVSFSNYLLSSMAPLVMMTNLVNIWANGMASARRIFEVLDTAPDVAEPQDGLRLPEPVRGEIRFENVSFRYAGSGDEEVLRKISFTAPAGKTLAILGATGAGKSSLINLIPRFYDPTGGRVLVDGTDVRSVTTESLLEHIAVVPQESILFSGTIADNLRYGKPEAAQAEIETAAKAAQAHEFIMGFPQGYATRVEERGANLSGGQKQRLAIARALVINPRILILDDATSAVDVETETKIQEALEHDAFRPTRIVVAQRISTVLKADQIIVIDRGRIAAQGTHADLLESSPIYQEIYASQLGALKPRPAAMVNPLNGTLTAQEAK